jgi:hypothetical protein
MSSPDEFYIGYLPKAPPRLAGFTRGAVVTATVVALAGGAALAMALPYFGTGEFEFGTVREFKGTLRCAASPVLVAPEADYVLVGEGKRRVAPEICGADGTDVTLRGTLIRRDGRQLLEIADVTQSGAAAGPEAVSVALGRFTLTGEIVDAKCYFGVMNPGEGRVHRACAVQCLRGGVPAVFVARDRAGATTPLLITGPTGEAINAVLLRWTGEPVEASGLVVRQGRWLVWKIDPASLKFVRGWSLPTARGPSV